MEEARRLFDSQSGLNIEIVAENCGFNSYANFDVAFTVTPSDRKIVLNIIVDAYRIEGVTLTVTAKDILDMHSNLPDGSPFAPLRYGDVANA